MIAVQESAFLPPPTQFDILYGFTDLAITMVMIVMVVVVVRMVMRMGYLQPSGSM